MKDVCCSMIRDLQPLYMENLLQPQSRQEVEGHLASCPACREYYEKGNRALPDCPSPLEKEEEQGKSLVQKIRRTQAAVRYITIWLAMMIGCWCLLFAGNWLSALPLVFLFPLLLTLFFREWKSVLIIGCISELLTGWIASEMGYALFLLPTAACCTGAGILAGLAICKCREPRKMSGKILWCVCAFLAAGLSLWNFVEMKGDPVSLLLARQKTAQYLSAAYGDSLRLGATDYRMKTREYVTVVSETEYSQHQSSIGCTQPWGEGTLSDYYQWETGEKYGEEVSGMLSLLFHSRMGWTQEDCSIDAGLDIPAGAYRLSGHYDPALPVSLRVQMHTLYADADAFSEDVWKAVQSIRESGLDVDHLTVESFLADGDRAYRLDCAGLPETLEQLRQEVAIADPEK